FESQAYRKDGTVIWVTEDITVVRDAAGSITHYQGFLLDVTQRKLAEGALRLTNASFELSSVPTFWLWPDGRFVRVNAAACLALEYSQAELETMSLEDIDPSLPASTYLVHWEELRRHNTLTLQSTHRARGGRTYPVEITFNYLAFEGQEFGFAFARD